MRRADVETVILNNRTLFLNLFDNKTTKQKATKQNITKQITKNLLNQLENTTLIYTNQLVNQLDKLADKQIPKEAARIVDKNTGLIIDKVMNNYVIWDENNNIILKATQDRNKVIQTLYDKMWDWELLVAW